MVTPMAKMTDTAHRDEAALTRVVHVCLFEVGQALAKQIWATRGHLFQMDSFWEMAEICGSSKVTLCKPLSRLEMW